MRNADTYIIDEDFTLDVVEDEEEDEVNEDSETCMTSVELKSPKEERKLTGIAALIEDIKESVKKKIMKLPDVCPVPSCRYKCQKEELFLRHLDHHICIADVMESVEKGEVFPEKCPVPFCEYKTQNKELFLSHIDHHLDGKLLKQYRCRGCNFITLHRNELRLHTAKCDFAAHLLNCPYKGCKFGTIKLTSLKTHVATKHPSIRSYICTLCRFKTQNIDVMQTHKNEVHPEVKGNMCKLPRFSSEDRSELILDQKRHVTVRKERIFKCSSCDYVSKYKISVLLHNAMRHSKHKVA